MILRRFKDPFWLLQPLPSLPIENSVRRPDIDHMHRALSKDVLWSLLRREGCTQLASPRLADFSSAEAPVADN